MRRIPSRRPGRPLPRRRRSLGGGSRRLRRRSRLSHDAVHARPDAGARAERHARPRRSAGRQRLRQALSAPDHPAEREDPPEGQRLLDDRLDSPRGPGRRVLLRRRLHGRAHDLPAAARGGRGPGRVRAVAGRDRQGRNRRGRPGPTSSTAPGRRRCAAARRTRRATTTRTVPTPSRRSGAGSTGCAPRRAPAPRRTSTATSEAQLQGRPGPPERGGRGSRLLRRPQ